MLNLRLYHGRHTPDEEIDYKLNDGWGFDGPVLEGITGMSWTYNVHLRVEFVDAAAAEAARQLTGWELWDTNILCLIKYEDLIMTEVDDPEAPHGNKLAAYYGDFALYQPS